MIVPNLLSTPMSSAAERNIESHPDHLLRTRDFQPFTNSPILCLTMDLSINTPLRLVQDQHLDSHLRIICLYKKMIRLVRRDENLGRYIWEAFMRKLDRQTWDKFVHIVALSRWKRWLRAWTSFSWLLILLLLLRWDPQLMNIIGRIKISPQHRCVKIHTLIRINQMIVSLC